VEEGQDDGHAVFMHSLETMRQLSMLCSRLPWESMAPWPAVVPEV